MSALTCERLESTAALRDRAAQWDDLWLRSDATLPTSRAELVAQWIEHFAPRSRAGAIVVRRGNQMIAALPLFATGPKRFSLGRMPGNAWSPAGELLLDPLADRAAACDRIVDGLLDLNLPIVLFDGATTSGTAGRQFAAALERRAVTTVVRRRFLVEQVEIAGDWQSYLASRARSHRRQIRRAQGKAEAVAALRLRILDPLAPGEIAKWLRRGLEIEDRGWKGAAASSVLKAPGMFDFYLEQALRLAGWGQLRLVFLELDGQPIAFEYGWLSKGVYFSPKVAYDEAFGQFSPGQLLRAALLERFHAGETCHTVDYLGPSSRATADWSTRSYPISRVVIAMSPAGRTVLGAYEMLRPLVKRFRGQSASTEQAAARPVDAQRPTADDESVAPAAV